MLLVCLLGALIYALVWVDDSTVDTRARDKQIQTCELGNEVRAAVRDLNDVIAAQGLPPSAVPGISVAWQRIFQRSFMTPPGLATRRCDELFTNNGEEH